MEATKHAGVEPATRDAETDGEERSAELFLIRLFMNPRVFGDNLIVSQY